MGELSITFDDHGLIARATAAPKVISDGLERVVTLGSIDAEGAVVSHTPVGATGHLRQSITHDVTGSGIAIVGRVYSTDVPIKVASVETGRAPGRMPPSGPIALWLQRKVGVSDADLKSVTFLVQRAIGRRGTKGAQMFHKGFEDARPKIMGRFNEFVATLGRLL